MKTRLGALESKIAALDARMAMLLVLNGAILAVLLGGFAKLILHP